MGPFRRFIVRFATRRALAKMHDMYAGDDLAQAAIDTASSDALPQIYAEVEKQLASNSEAKTALDATGIDPNTHPFLAWLLSPQGMAFIWSIVSVILSIWHIPLPPLPPIPPTP